MSLVGLLLGDLTPLIVGLRATEYTLAACAMLWVYEYTLTLDREVALVWASPWSFGKVMFFLNRYSPIIDIVLANYILLGVRNQGNCNKLAPALTWFLTTGTLWPEIILAMRTWAIWGGSKRMLGFLIAFITAIFIAACIVTERFLESITYIHIPKFLVPMGLTCAPLPKHDSTWLEFVVFMISQSVIGFLALSRGISRYHSTNNPLLATMFHDGLLYYVYTLVLTIANLVVAVAAPIQWGIILELPLRVLSSIFCTRILLNIRGSYFKPSDATTTYNDRGAKSTSFGFQHQARPSHSHSQSSSDRQDGSTTFVAYDTVYYNEIDSDFVNEEEEGPSRRQSWIWNDQRPPQLTLRPMTPFGIEIANLLHPPPPSL